MFPLRITDFKTKLLYLLVCIKFITSYGSFNAILASESQISSCIKCINLRMKKKNSVEIRVYFLSFPFEQAAYLTQYKKLV